jgi:hypothetical protein
MKRFKNVLRRMRADLMYSRLGQPPFSLSGGGYKEKWVIINILIILFIISAMFVLR